MGDGGELGERESGVRKKSHASADAKARVRRTGFCSAAKAGAGIVVLAANWPVRRASGSVGCFPDLRGMQPPSFEKLVPILQLSIGPVILISGVGLLLLTLTNRFGRLVDRTRQLKRELDAGLPPERSGPIHGQIAILLQRARILRLAVLLGTTTVLLASVLMLLLFVSALVHLELTVAIVAVFSLALVALIGSMLAFMHDMNTALAAVRLEVREKEKSGDAEKLKR